MLYPSIDDLLKTIDSKYTLVTISAQRARELQETDETNIRVARSESHKLVGKALEEIQEGKLNFKSKD
ncbi:DNA-directed RNA polymerase subunit omega [Salsuginibacillus kocurii]|uniref:DNA-directed RNA polymerase subunit omega n=1 Tax=Salsuginibacillus kocurii TaxID=427078 RepID=UPI000381F3CD|nr:DNA-directed RNA polymerase subunit omega [Salsuginibacillus kocurii]